MLDSIPLGLMCHPNAGAEVRAWCRGVGRSGAVLAVPEVADYEVRRELIRLRKSASIRRLDDYKRRLLYLPIKTDAMLLAAELWAQARRRGRPGADPAALDGDVIIAAQAQLLVQLGNEVLVATDNITHFTAFVDARRWQDIT